MPELPQSPTATALAVQVRHALGALSLNASFSTSAGWTVLFGPSGSGKTSVLRAIAGSLRPAHGSVVVHGSAAQPLVVVDRARDIDLPAYRRPFRVAAQRPALFPRQSVRENVRYGVGRQLDIAEQTMERLHLLDLAANRVERLSGGETQRVALARAIAAARAAGSGTWLLLDEPFTGLDLARRAELTGDLPIWLRELGHPVLSVTHDVAEVFALGAEVIRIEAGRVVAQGSPEAVLARERDSVLAALDGSKSSP